MESARPAHTLAVNWANDLEKILVMVSEDPRGGLSARTQ